MREVALCVKATHRLLITKYLLQMPGVGRKTSLPATSLFAVGSFRVLSSTGHEKNPGVVAAFSQPARLFPDHDSAGPDRPQMPNNDLWTNFLEIFLSL